MQKYLANTLWNRNISIAENVIIFSCAHACAIFLSAPLNQWVKIAPNYIKQLVSKPSLI